MITKEQHMRYLELRDKNKVRRISELLNETLVMLPESRVCPNDGGIKWEE